MNCSKLQAHIAKRRKRNPFWQLVGSQAVQDICQRIEKAYQLFFKHHKKGVRPPGFKKVKKYKSFTLKQAGYKFLGGNRIKIGSRVYQYWNSREIEGTVKTLTIKRTPLGELFMVVVVDDVCELQIKSSTGNIGGFDFGLKTFLTCSDGSTIESPLFLKKKGKPVVYIDPWYPSSKTCSCCGHVLESLDLSVRRWRCPSCQSENDRDENASLNIQRVGSSTLGVEDVRQSATAILA